MLQALVVANLAVLAAVTHRLVTTRPKSVTKAPKPADAAAKEGQVPTIAIQSQAVADEGISQPKHIAALHRDWVPGVQQPLPFKTDDFVGCDPATMDSGSLYALLISSVTPRPVGFVSTISAAGDVNLSPYSYFNAVSNNPPCLVLGMCRSSARGGGKKDSLQNVEETGELVVHIISEWCLEAANHTCAEAPPGVDEMALAGLTPVPSLKVKPPRVKECAVQMECKLKHIYELSDRDGKPTASVVIAEVVQFHIAAGVIGHSPTGKLIVDPVKLRPVSRMGGATYGLLREFVDLPRPDSKGLYAGGRLGPYARTD